MLTLTEAAALYAQHHGIELSPAAIKYWCQRGWIAGAYNTDPGSNRGRWQVPEEALLAFTPPQRGWQKGRRRIPSPS